MEKKAVKKRGQNEGTIFQRSDGLWVSRISLGYDTLKGKRKQKTFYGKTKDEVRRKLTDAQHGNDRGINVAPRSQTVGDFLSKWLSEVVRPGVRPSTYRSYEQITRNHLIPGLGKVTLQKLTPQQVQTFINAKAADGISTEHLRRVLRAALSQAIRWDLVPRNVASLVSIPKTKKHEIAYLSVEEAREFLDSVRGHRHEALFTVALAIGLRLGEATGLRWDDVDLENGTVHVKKQLQRIDGKLTLVDLKTSRARRVIPLPSFAIRALREHKARQHEWQIIQADVWNDQGLVFTSTIGTPVDLRNVRRELAGLLKGKNLPKLRFHDLRHTCATLLLVQGTDHRTIMETLGHSQISLTMNTYSHVLPTLQREAADRMDEILKG